MAITKIFPVRKRLDHLLSYIADGEKTANGSFITGINCAPETAYESMSASFILNDKPLRVQGYHIIQSFVIDEVSADNAHKVGIKLAEQLFGDSFQVIVATHTNTDVIHNHIALCSTSFIDGHRYHSCKASYREIREGSDSLCREHNLSIIENPERGRYKTTAEVKAERSSNQTWLSVIRADVDEAIAKATSSNQFLSNLQRLGYEVKAGKDLSVRPPGKERYVRLARNLGETYTHEGIVQRILNQPYPEALINKQHYVADKPKKLPTFARGSIAALYRHYLYLFGYWQKQVSNSNARMHYLLRDDIRKLDAIVEDERLLRREDIESSGQLDAFCHFVSRTIEELALERKPLYQLVRKADDQRTASDARERIAEINKRLKIHRKELRQCGRIIERSDSILDKISCIEKDQELVLKRREQQRDSKR